MKLVYVVNNIRRLARNTNSSLGQDVSFLLVLIYLYYLMKIYNAYLVLFAIVHINIVLVTQAVNSSSNSAMGIFISADSSPENINASKKNSGPSPIETRSKLPSPLPTWPPGNGFASGTIDLGGLLVCQVSTFTKVWATHEGGPDDLGATFFEPSALADGYFMLGGYTQPNNKPLSGLILAGKDAANDPSGGVLKPPIDYTLVWSSESLNISQDSVGYIWMPTPPDGYRAVGHVVTTSPERPSLEKVRCVRSDFTDVCGNGDWIWSYSDGINVYESMPRDIGTHALAVGTFIAQNNTAASSLACLKNAKATLSAMPNLDQIQALVKEYSPWIYFHPDEDYLPSSTAWFSENGALLYTKGQESNPVPIDPSGSNLPQGGSNDGAYWLDLPADEAGKEKLKAGNLQGAVAYLHVKPMLGATFTDIAVWIFYPFNGAAKAKFEVFNVSLGRIGEHVGDWEHLTLRISNFNGELIKVYFSQHSKGTWEDAGELEYQNGNKPVWYSSLHGHAAYPSPGVNLHGKGNIGIRDDTAKGDLFMDTGINYTIIAAEYLKETAISEPPWLNYAREWGPKINYTIEDEANKVAKKLPIFLRKPFQKFINGLPNEVLGEEGPIGPKWKDNWDGDERAG